MATTHLQDLISQAYILGGSPCSGKSTVAEMVSARYDFCYYKADDHESEHMQRAQPDQQPTMFKYANMAWNEIFSQSPNKLFADELSHYRERFPFILEDLKQLDLERPAILEGAAFLPELLNQFSVNYENVAFMVPTFEFQHLHYSQRPWIQSILSECHDPQQAFENWMNRDAMFAHEVAKQAHMYGFKVITVDGSLGIQQQFEAIRALFKLS